MVVTTAKSGQKIQTILDQYDGVAVLDFYKKSSSESDVLINFAQQLNADSNIPLLKIDIDSAPDLTYHFDIQTVPTFVVVKDKWNNPIHIVPGLNQETVRKVFDTASHNKRHNDNTNFTDL